MRLSKSLIYAPIAGYLRMNPLISSNMAGIWPELGRDQFATR
ncbi:MULTISPECIES: hypothetical protein [Rhodobacterales]|nr:MULTISPECIES: hypothetical protein [Rhodobacterales]